MKILQIGPVPEEAGGLGIGGISSHLWSLARKLRERSHDITVLADNLCTEDVGPFSIDGIRIYGAPITLATQERQDIITGNTSPRMTDAITRYREVIEDVEPDIIHVHTIDDRYYLARKANRTKAPLISTVHSNHFIDYNPVSERDVRTSFIRSNLESARSLIFVSHFVRNRHIELISKPSNDLDMNVIYNPIDTSLFKPIPQTVAKERVCPGLPSSLILYVGQFIPRKRIDLLIKAVGLLRERGFEARLMLIGQGTEEGSLRELIQKTGLSHSIELLRPKPQAELPAYYSAADFFVLPSAMEGFALASIEAMLCGCPVIGTPESLRELVPDDRYGRFVTPATTETLARVMEDALAREWDRDLIRNHALCFDWENKISEFEDSYENAIKTNLR